MAGTGESTAASQANEMVQYCFNPKTKEIVEGKLPPNEAFVPIIGYFRRPPGTDPLELQKMIEEIASRQESALDYDEYSGDENECATDSNIPGREQ